MTSQTPEDKGGQAPDQRATAQTPENAPSTVSDREGSVESHPGAGEVDTTRRVEHVGTRVGMFGVRGSGDTSGYGGLVQATILPGAAQRPFGGWFDEAYDALAAAWTAGPLEQAVPHVVIHRGELTLHVHRDHLLEVARLMRDDARLRFELCSGVSGVHYPQDAGAELHVVVHLLSMTHNRRLRLEVTCHDADPHVPSIVPVYPTADWHERETYDMFGVIFDGHPSLTRILMPDDWPGHPQRKDYPLGGIPVEYKGGTVPPPDQRRAYN